MGQYPPPGANSVSFAQGTAAARPATPATQFYWANDTQELSVANPTNTGWLNIAKTTGNFNPTNNLTVGANLGFTGSSAFLSGGAASLLLASGDFDINTNGKGLKVVEGANNKQGTFTANGTTNVTVNNTAVTANSRIFFSLNLISGAPGVIGVVSRIAGTSFTVVSTAATDLGTYAYEIFEPG